MRKRSIRKTIVDANGCASCGAMAEQPCRTNEGQVTQPHQARWDAYSVSLRTKEVSDIGLVQPAMDAGQPPERSPVSISEVLSRLIVYYFPDAVPLYSEVLGFEIDWYTNEVVATWQEMRNGSIVRRREVVRLIDLTELIAEAARIAAGCPER